MNEHSTCGDCEGLLARAAEATPTAPLDADSQARLDRHLSSCPSCRDALNTQVGIRALLATRPPVPASPAFRVRVREAVEAEASRAGVAGLLDFRRWTWRLVPVAAAMGLAAMLGITQVTPEPAVDDERMSAIAAELPVSAALYSTNVTDESLLSLMLGSSVDDRLGSVEVQR